MIGLWILLALQLAATALGFGYLWRRQERLGAEIARLREAPAGQEVARVEAGGGAAARRRPRLAEQLPVGPRSEGAAVNAITPEWPILRANLAFRALEVPAGTHRVEFRFPPASARHGLIASTLFLLLSIGAAFYRSKP